ncbi:MAG: HAMP domain-containing protein [Chitinophagales bacterium]|nr:HAMP domain-containing protein [Chitinophagales bacterium]
MKTRVKITLGVGVLFALIVLQALIGARQMYLLSDETRNILKDNYISLSYARSMLDALEKHPETAPARSAFEQNLQLQESNITEVGESEATQLLRRHFDSISPVADNTRHYTRIRAGLNTIMKVNLEAIERKSIQAEKTAKNTIFWLSLLGTGCFLIAFTLLFNLPASIADPIRELSASIKQIAAGNYRQRLHFSQRNEFGDVADAFNTMAEKLQAYNNSNLARLMTEKKRIETLIDTMHDPVIGLDEQDKILFINDTALAITGLKRSEVQGKAVAMVAAGNDLLQALLNVRQAGEQGGKGLLRIFLEGKEQFYDTELLNIEATPVQDLAPRYLGQFILLRNVTAYKELDQAKTNFIATISHEYKTPITAIKMSLQLLEDERAGGELNPVQQELVHSIRDDAERLLRITGELLDMAQVESGKIKLELSAVAPELLVRRAVDAIRTQAEQRQTQLQIEVPEGLAPVHADADKAIWILKNLLTNAIRYSPEMSQVQVTVQEEQSVLVFSIADQGPGIAPQYLKKIFERYFRVPGRSEDGSGLGLAISKEFAEAQGGSISVTSTQGKGSTFALRLKKA